MATAEASSHQNSSESSNELPPVTVEDIRACSFESWFPLFRSAKVTFPTRFVTPLSAEFMRYLNSDGVFLPKAFSTPAPRRSYDDDDSDDDWGSDSADNDEDTEASIQQSFPDDFPEVREAIQKAIDDFGPGSAVFPKLNWSAPMDADWMVAGGRLRCNNAADVLLLLKSSNSVAQHDLAMLNTHSPHIPPVLVLRKWYDLQPSLEFRCFVVNQELVAVSQRDCANYYEFLVKPETRKTIRSLISTFFREKIRPLFPLKSYVFDVYIAKNWQRVWLVDFNVFGLPTHPLLFHEWDTVISCFDRYIANSSEDNDSSTNHEDRFDLRLVDSPVAIIPSQAMYSRLPSDMFDVSNAEKIQQFIDNASRQFS